MRRRATWLRSPGFRCRCDGRGFLAGAENRGGGRGDGAQSGREMAQESRGDARESWTSAWSPRWKRRWRRQRTDSHKLLGILRQLEDEEPQLAVRNGRMPDGTEQICVRVMGAIQLERCCSLIEERFGVKTEFKAPGAVPGRPSKNR